jgi:hypothetical protein
MNTTNTIAGVNTIAGTKTVAWVHDECLNADWLGETPALFVFEEAALSPTLKQLAFVYECLLELPVEIRRGTLVDEVVAFAKQHGATRVRTVRTPDPHKTAIIEALRSRLEVEVVPEPEFVSDAQRYPLKRFSAFWKAVEKQLLG